MQENKNQVKKSDWESFSLYTKSLPYSLYTLETWAIFQSVLTKNIPYLYGCETANVVSRLSFWTRLTIMLVLQIRPECYWSYCYFSFLFSQCGCLLLSLYLIMHLFHISVASDWILSICEQPFVRLQSKLEAETAEHVYGYFAWQGVCPSLSYGECGYWIFISGTVASLRF